MSTDPPLERSGYDYDEIMRRLKRNGQESREGEREVVIDAETGEKKVRVRRRRRSSQTTAHQSSGRAFNRLLNLSWMALMVLIALVLVFWFLRTSRFASAGFADSFGQQLSEWLPGTVQSSNWYPRFTRLNANRIVYQGSPEEAVERVELRGIESTTTVSELMFGQDLKLPYLKAQTAELVLRQPRAAAGDPRGGFPGWEAPVPTGLASDILGIDRFHLRFAGRERKRPDGSHSGLSDAMLRVNFHDHSFESFGGELRFDSWPVLSDVEFVGRPDQQMEHLVIERFEGLVSEHNRQGSLRASGRVSWRGTGTSEFEFSGETVPVGALLHEGTPFAGMLSGWVSLEDGRLVVPAEGPFELQVRIVSEQLRVRDFDAFRNLSIVLQNEELLTPSLDNFQATLSYRDGRWELGDIQAASEQSLLSFEGDLSWAEEDELGGILRVGVPQRLFSMSRIEQSVANSGIVFTIAADGMLYAELPIEGDDGGLSEESNGGFRGTPPRALPSPDSGTPEAAPTATDTDPTPLPTTEVERVRAEVAEVQRALETASVGSEEARFLKTELELQQRRLELLEREEEISRRAGEAAESAAELDLDDLPPSAGEIRDDQP